jgi:NAD+ kinase
VFHTIGLIGKFGEPGIAPELLTLTRHLQSRGRRVIVDPETARAIADPQFDVVPASVLATDADLVVVIGGDGTLLHAARALADAHIPLVGVNLGRLGFLVDVSPDTMCQRLDEIMEGKFCAEDRFLLEAEVHRQGEVLGTGVAFNDVVVHKRDVARMIEFETHVDGTYVTTHRADGLIIATPTGSTAYALSGGGPLIYPTLDAIVLVPICPHTLSNRPIVVGASSVIEVVISDPRELDGLMTCDGQDKHTLNPGDRIVVRRKAERIRLIHPADHDYFQILRVKLGWGGGHRERIGR